MIRELKILLTAMMFYTRLPVPRISSYSSDMLSQSTRYLPFIGWIVGGLGGLLLYVLDIYIGQSSAVVLTLVFMVLLTGAFHEDALADFCDGFGGGYTVEKILTIMKDSRIGTYGATALVLLFVTKYTLLISFEATVLPLVLLTAHAFSRFSPVVIIFTSQYVAVQAISKAKPIAKKTEWKNLIIAMLFGVLPLLLFNIFTIVVILLTQIVIWICYRYYIHKKIGGYTGDVLGALQQISEVACYVVFLWSGYTQSDLFMFF